VDGLTGWNQDNIVDADFLNFMWKHFGTVQFIQADGFFSFVLCWHHLSTLGKPETLNLLWGYRLIEG
jgi:hypothetical protein